MKEEQEQKMPFVNFLERIIYLRKIIRDDIQESLMLENRLKDEKNYVEALMEQSNQENFEYFLGRIEDILIQGKKTEEL